MTVKVEWAAVARALARRSGRCGPGLPQLTTILSAPSENSKDRQPAWAAREKSGGGGRPGVDEHERIVRFEPLIARIAAR